jgi:hypothetical protein
VPPLSIFIGCNKRSDGLYRIVCYCGVGRKNKPDPHGNHGIRIENGRAEKAERNQPEESSLAKKEQAEDFIST